MQTCWYFGALELSSFDIVLWCVNEMVALTHWFWWLFFFFSNDSSVWQNQHALRSSQSSNCHYKTKGGKTTRNLAGSSWWGAPNIYCPAPEVFEVQVWQSKEMTQMTPHRSNLIFLPQWRHHMDTHGQFSFLSSGVLTCLFNISSLESCASNYNFANLEKHVHCTHTFNL